jgi:hypothetical protein
VESINYLHSKSGNRKRKYLVSTLIKADQNTSQKYSYYIPESTVEEKHRCQDEKVNSIEAGTEEIYVFF